MGGWIMHKNYFAVIPANVRYDKNITSGAKLLYGEITALSNQEGYCWASNRYFAELYNVSNVTISKWVSQLAKSGHITTEIKYKQGTKQILNRYIKIVHDPTKKSLSTSQRKVNEPLKEKFKDNNTVNNTINNTSNKDIVGQPDIPFKKIIEHLNKVTNKNYRHTTRKTKDLIKARFNEGFKLHDFIRVIEIKNAEWRNDGKMKRFLRPETLFGTKFESYLNQEDISTDNPFEYDPNVDSF